MAKNDEVAGVVAELLDWLAKTPVHKADMLKRYEPAQPVYADAIGALRVLGLIKIGKDKLVSLTEIGRHIVENPVAISPREIVEAFRAHRGLAQKGRTPPDEYWLPSVASLCRHLEQVPDRTTQTLQAIRKNAQRMNGKTSRAEMKFGLAIYISAIDREFERRMQELDCDGWFKWPETDAPGGDGSVGKVEFMPEGMLAAVGYRVGNRNGAPLAERRQLLRHLFEGVLPPLFPSRYMSKWGAKGSARRLHTLADTIAALTRNLKRRHDDRMDMAIGEYESDLEFLYETYYVDKFGFAWPSTHL